MFRLSTSRLLSSLDPSNRTVRLRDRVLLAVMIHSFARVSAVIGMNVEDHPYGRAQRRPCNVGMLRYTSSTKCGDFARDLFTALRVQIRHNYGDRLNCAGSQEGPGVGSASSWLAVGQPPPTGWLRVDPDFRGALCSSNHSISSFVRATHAQCHAARLFRVSRISPSRPRPKDSCVAMTLGVTRISVLRPNRAFALSPLNALRRVPRKHELVVAKAKYPRAQWLSFVKLTGQITKMQSALTGQRS